MRTEDKEIDGLDLELAERQHKGSLGVDHDARTLTDGALPDFGTDSQRDVDRQRNTRLIDAMRQILDANERVVERRITADALKISELGLPEREAKALQALQESVLGRKETGEMVFAEDRRELLEQALAVLQPNLTSGSTSELTEIPVTMDELMRSVGDLRETLGDLEDAQEELIGADAKAAFAEKPKPGKPDEPIAPPDPDKPRPPSTLAGPGPEAKRETPPSTLSTGPEVKVEPAKSTLSDGPAVKPEPEAPTTLGDAKDIAEAQKQAPWWRRPGG